MHFNAVRHLNNSSAFQTSYRSQSRNITWAFPWSVRRRLSPGRVIGFFTIFSAFKLDKFGESSSQPWSHGPVAAFYFPTWRQTWDLLPLAAQWWTMAHLRGQAGIVEAGRKSLQDCGCSTGTVFWIFLALGGEDMDVSRQKIEVAGQKSRSSLWITRERGGESVPRLRTGTPTRLRCLRSRTHIFRPVRHSLCVAHCLTASSNK